MPNKDDLVWVKVLQVSDTSATVVLLEYANIEGMIPYTEFTRLRIRALGKVIKAGRCEAACVLRMDAEKGYIDLSKKQVTRVEAVKCEEGYHKAKDVHSIVCHAADACEVSQASAMEAVAWRLCDKSNTRHAYDWLKDSVTNPAVLDVLNPEFQLAEAARKDAERAVILAAAQPALDKALAPALQAAVRARLEEELSGSSAAANINSNSNNLALAASLKEEQMALIREAKRTNEEFAAKMTACHTVSRDDQGRESVSVNRALKEQLGAQRDAAVARLEAAAEKKSLDRMKAEGVTGEGLLHSQIDAQRKEREALEKELEREKKCSNGGPSSQASERLLQAQLAETTAYLDRLVVDLTQLSSKSSTERHGARVRRVEITERQISACQLVADAYAAGSAEKAAKLQRVDDLRALLPMLQYDVQRSTAELLESEAAAHRAESSVLREEQERLGINIQVLCEKVAQAAQHRLKAQPVKIHTSIEVTCTTEEGIICIRDVLRIGQAQGKTDPPIDIAVSIVAPPAYLLRSLTEQREEGIRKHYDAVKAMEQEMARRGGSVKIVAAPRVIGEEEDLVAGGGASAAAPGDDDSDDDAEAAAK
jgi:translation initiation factor 2 alpha subunit (eIF-2alpha)